MTARDENQYRSRAWRMARVTPNVLIGLVLIAVFVAQYQVSTGPETPIILRESVVKAEEATNVEPFEALIRRDPLAALIDARVQHLNEVTDYACVMVKQEKLPTGMSQEQEIAVKFRHAPYSVYMEWQRNPGLASRVIYVKGRWTNASATAADERELAIAQPGVIARFFVKSIKQPIHGRLAKKSSRRFIDEFGFEKTLDRLIHVCEVARSRGELTLEFLGDSQFDNRPVWVIRRQLPYTGEGGRYPDRMAEILIDKALRIPVAVYCFAETDRQPGNLIAKYEYRNIRMQVGLTEADFEPATYGM